MKRILLLALFAVSLFSLKAQDRGIITVYTFYTNEGADRFKPTAALPANMAYPITLEDIEGNDYTLTLAGGAGDPNGGPDYAAAAQGWEDGAGKKFFSIKCEAAAYMSFSVTSIMYSDSTHPGPKDWKVMWRLTDGEWNDLEGGTFSIANDWITGEVSTVPLPEAANNPERFIYFAWMPTTNLDVNGDPVTADGSVRIDDIIINGFEGNGIESLEYENSTTIYPNPAQTTCTISAGQGASALDIYDLSGRLVYANNAPKRVNSVSLSALSSGVYMVRVSYDDVVVNRKLVVR